MTQAQAYSHWVDSAKEDWKVVQTLYKNKHYVYCLFFCHLTLEKLLKALVIKKLNTSPPAIHDLTLLAEKAKLQLTTDIIADLTVITTFNIQARYDTYKTTLYKKATPLFTQEYLTKTEQIRILLTSQL